VPTKTAHDDELLQFDVFQSALSLLPLNFMQRVLPEALAELHQFDLLHPSGNLDLSAVVEVARLRALQPHVLAIVFCHDYTRKKEVARIQ
jgi:hypothetical protein